MQWRSLEGVLILLTDAGELTTTTNSLTVPALVPGTVYQFRLSALTLNGRGAEVRISGQTQFSRGEPANAYMAIKCSLTSDGVLFLVFRQQLGILPTPDGTNTELH